MNQPPFSREAIAERAYLLWDQAGRPAGRDQEFWLRAQDELAAQAAEEIPAVLSAAAPVKPKRAATKKTADVSKRPPTRPRAPKRA